MLYKWIIKPLLFAFQPERAHHLAFGALKMMKLVPGLLNLIRTINAPPKEAQVVIAGIRFPSRVGLAAGFDKDAKAVEPLAALGFGFIEVGTVTPKPQKGNPLPRLFRLTHDKALINRMGFNNEGIDAVVQRLIKINRKGLVIGGNIGKNKDTPNEQAVSDYLICMRALVGLVDYLVVNISSPNTPGLRQLQDKEPLRHLLESVVAENRKCSHPVPLFLKVAPDITFEQADDIIEIVIHSGFNGLIVSNTTISRDGLITGKERLNQIGAGGLSGRPLMNRSTELLRYFKRKSPDSLILISSGGIMSMDDAREKFEAGASLVQLYTGFVYEGPALVRKINHIPNTAPGT
ncbi:MAG: quinone-dependent dihydroorotate dehydrogenase [Bacteroidota bacterium]